MNQGTTMRSGHREQGMVFLLGIVLLGILTALAHGFFTVVQKNSRQSRLYTHRSELRQYAEGGVHMALNEMGTGVNGGDGNIGTETWMPSAHDLGKDGKSSTKDEGEGDGRPTPGEPALSAASVGSPSRGIGLLVRSADSSWSGIKQIISTAFDGETEVTVEVFARTGPASLPRTAFYLHSSLIIEQYDGDGASGYDTNSDGTPGPEAPVAAFMTDPGAPRGSNLTKVRNQIKDSARVSVTGLGGTSSFAETTTPIDVNALFEYFKAKATVTYSGAGLSLNNAYAGTWTKPEITYFDGKKWSFSGSGRASGILLVDTEEYVNSGDMSFKGLVIVRLRKVMTLSGGPTPHVYGSLMVIPHSSVASTVPVYKQSGSGEVVFSSQALRWAESQLGGGGSYEALHWGYLH